MLFLRTSSGGDTVSRLWALDLDWGNERVVAEPPDDLDDADLPEAERIRRERTRTSASGITSYATDREASLAVYALNGRLWVAATGREAAPAREVPTATAVYDPRVDPTGRHVAYLADGTLRLVGIDGGGDRKLVAPDGEAVSWGVAEHVAAESMDRTRGYWWSPDGEHLLVARVDESGVDVWYLSDPSDPAAPPQARRYPAVGRPNAEVTLWIVGLDGSRVPVDFDRDAFEYVATGDWDDHGPLISVQSRDQRTLRVLAGDAASGATTTLRKITDPCWTRLVGGVPARTGSGALITVEASEDTWRLCVGGEPVSPVGVQVQAVLGVDGETVHFTACTVATHVDTWQWRPGSGARRRSAPESGVHTSVDRRDLTVEVRRDADRVNPYVTVLRNGEPVAGIASLAEQPATALNRKLLTVGPRRLNVAVHKPSRHRPGTPLPVLMDPYGGPAARKVFAFQSGGAFISQWFAENGFAVVVVDGAGTPGRGPAFEREIWANKIEPVLDDQVAALHALAAEDPDLDLTRVGIRGWSYGGYLAAAAVLRRPQVFHASVAGAGTLDMRLYDTHWQERYLGQLDENPDAYEQDSLFADAPGLHRPLLLVHGLADDNVWPVNTLRLSAALVAAGRYHEVLPLPSASHMAGDPVVTENLLRHELTFLRRSLGLPDGG